MLLAPTLVVCAEVAASLLPWRRVRIDRSRPRPRIAILIPAHDEALVITNTLTSVAPQLAAGDRLVVVADNCTDTTAELARRAGATVIERHDVTRRGKGFALDFGVQSLAGDPPEIVILLDADVTLRAGAIEALARQAAQTQCAAQGLYILREAPAADGHDLVSHLAFVVRNQVRPLGLARLGGPCPLFGAGMAFPWEMIRNAPLASSNIVEDMALGLDLAAAGRAPLLCTDAFIDGTLPKTPEVASTQRRRWEHGHLRTIMTHVPKTFISGIIGLRPRAIMLAADLAVPPLSFYVLVLALVGAIFFAVALVAGASYHPAISLWVADVLLIVFLLVAWFRYSPHGMAMRPLLSVPTYVVRKVPMYLAAFTRGEKEWKRTERETPPPAAPPKTS